MLFRSGLARFLEGDGWIAWGAIPTDRPIGERSTTHWKVLAGLWCELTQRGCDAERLRRQALVTPACGLFTHAEQVATRVFTIVREVSDHLNGCGGSNPLSIGA